MSFSLAIASIIILDVALIAGLAFVMSRASLLIPHVSRRDEDGAVADTAVVVRTPIRPASRRASRRPQTSAAR
jgi:hypothetical protein